MKSILLTTTALVAFAGAAAADGHAGVSFGGGATLGYNDAVEDGFYWSADVATTMSAGLDNGITASATFGIDVASDNLGIEDLDAVDYVLSVSSETASLSFGDVAPAEDMFSGVDGSSVSFFDKDNHLVAGDLVPGPDPIYDAIIIGEATMAGITAAVSYGVSLDGGAPNGKDLDTLQVYAGGEFGMVSLEGAYQGQTG